MPRREIGLMGYIGEVIVGYWLKNVAYPDPAYSIVYQIKPVDYPPEGGPYLDFGVIKEERVHAIYEVKSQDYALDNVNNVLTQIWNNKTAYLKYKTRDENGSDARIPSACRRHPLPQNKTAAC